MQRPPRFAHRATEALFGYWDRKRGDRVAPERSEIEPADIRTILPDTFILEVTDQNRVAWRLAGTRVCALHCRELKGRDYLGDWTGADKDSIQGLIEAVRVEGAVAIVQFEGQSRRKQALAHELVLLPLDVFGRSERRVLGAIVPLDQPYWIGVEPPLARKITGMRLVWPSLKPKAFGTARPAAPTSVPNAGQIDSIGALAAPGRPANLGGQPPVLVSAEMGARRVRHLMVFEGGKAREPAGFTVR